MNLLEYYIKEVHSVSAVPSQDWMLEPHVEVDVTVTCHGRVDRKRRVLPVSYWEEAKEKGFFMW